MLRWGFSWVYKRPSLVMINYTGPAEREKLTRVIVITKKIILSGI